MGEIMAELGNSPKAEISPTRGLRILIIIIGIAALPLPPYGFIAGLVLMIFGWTLTTSLNHDLAAKTPRDETISDDARLNGAHAKAVWSSFTATPAVKIPLFGAKKAATELTRQNVHLQELISQHGLLPVAEAQLRKEQIEGEIQALQVVHDDTRRETEILQSELLSVRDQLEMQNAGLYNFAHPAESSAELAAELAGVRAGIKDLVRKKAAIHATENFTFNGSAAQGRKFVTQMSTLMLRAYNAEAENCVKTVRAGNLATAIKRLDTAREQIARQGVMADLHVESAYHAARVRELGLAAAHLQKLQSEKEEERAQREELREQRRVELELAKAKEKLQKELSHYRSAMAALEANGDIEGAQRLRNLVEDTERAIQDVDYRAANMRAGYVYVISNVGAFGGSIVKIGMTRRLEPMDRVRELGDASVPFRFDVHALFFAEDAVGVETMLHQTFSEQRVNKVNLKREFFYVTPDSVLEALKSHNVEVVEYTTDALAEEFRISTGLADTTV